jgi:hypothetical protein
VILYFREVLLSIRPGLLPVFSLSFQGIAIPFGMVLSSVLLRYFTAGNGRPGLVEGRMDNSVIYVDQEYGSGYDESDIVNYYRPV